MEASDCDNKSETIAVYPDYSIDLTAGIGGTVEGSGFYEYGSTISILAKPDPGYMFDAWYENGEIIYKAPAAHELTVDSNRTLEARFKPNDLIINNIEVFGSIETNGIFTITAETTGGMAPLQWSFKIYGDGEIYYSDDDSSIDFFEWLPISSGDFTVAAYCTDGTGLKVSYVKTFSVAGCTVIGKIRSYNPNNATTLILLKDNVGKYTTTIGAISGSSQTDQPFRFTNVDPGTYTLIITKSSHLSYTLNNIEIGVAGETVLDLTQDSRDVVKLMTLLCGDLNSDGIIDAKDLNTVWSSLNYGKRTSDAENPFCDLNGDGVIDAKDLNIVWSSENYGKRNVVISWR